jgi:hypothetical protein
MTEIAGYEPAVLERARVEAALAIAWRHVRA